MNQLNKNYIALLLVGLLFLAGVRGLTQVELSMYDPDLWWHLRTGEWVVENRTVPQTDPFSVYGAGKPWVSYCWLNDLVLYAFYACFGLAGMPLFLSIMWVLIVAELFALLHRAQPSVLLALALTFIGYISLAHQYGPRPWLWSMLALLLELDILLTATRRQDYRLLWLLPPLFLAWTTVHAQFLNGLLILGCAVFESAAVRFVRVPAFFDTASAIPFPRMLAVFVACVAATFLTPYHYHIYEAVWELGTEMKLWNMIQDHMSLSFRSVPHWLVLGLTLATAMLIGYRRQVRLSLLLMYLGGIVCAYRGARDSWLVVFPCLLILADSIPMPEENPVSLGWLRATGIAGGTFALLALVASQTLSQARLAEAVARNWPEKLATFVEAQGYTGPLANHHNWGGYLMWRLRTMPVTMDQRTTVHHEDRIVKHNEAWSGMRGWENDPELQAAKVVIAQQYMPLSQLLRTDPRFKKIYEDEHGVVFIARPASEP